MEKISKVIKFFRILASNDKKIAERLIKDEIMKTIKHKFILSGSLESTHSLYIESVRLWMTCLNYELDHGGFVEILRQLLLVVEKINFNEKESIDRVCHVFNVVNIITNFGSKYPNASWGWVHVISLLQPSQKILSYISDEKNSKICFQNEKDGQIIFFSTLNLISSIFFYFSSIFDSIFNSPNKDHPSTQQQVATILEKQIIPFTQSPFFVFLLKNIQNDSKKNVFSSVPLSSVSPFVNLLDPHNLSVQYNFLSSLVSSVNSALKLSPDSYRNLPTNFFNSQNFYELSNILPYDLVFISNFYLFNFLILFYFIFIFIFIIFIFILFLFLIFNFLLIFFN